MKHTALIFVLLLVDSVGTADETQMASVFKQFMAAPDSPVILRGDYFRATLIAYRDFAKIVPPNVRDSDTKNARRAPNPPDIRDYDISIDQTPTSFIVQLGPATRDPSHVVFGGGAKYIIDRDSMKIQNRTLLK
jgi:hypothetical protein